MDVRLSNSAEAILAAGFDAAQNSAGQDAFRKADWAVERAVGRLCVDHAGESKGPVIDALTEVVQLYVRERLARASV